MHEGSIASDTLSDSQAPPFAPSFPSEDVASQTAGLQTSPLSSVSPVILSSVEAQQSLFHRKVLALCWKLFQDQPG